MPIILETKHFIIKAHDKPHHSRENGGHLVITPKGKYVHRWEMPLDQATEFIQLSMILGEAAVKVMRAVGIEIVRINFQDNGNWSYKPNSTKEKQVHLHLYLRAQHETHPDKDPRFQAFPEGLVFPPYESGYYAHFAPLTDADCLAIRQEIFSLLKTDKYKDTTIQL